MYKGGDEGDYPLSFMVLSTKKVMTATIAVVMSAITTLSTVSAAVDSDNGLPENLTVEEATVAHYESANNYYTGKVSIDKTSMTLGVKESCTLQAVITNSNNPLQSVSWSSSNPKIVTVDSNGKITGVSVGSATITAALENGSTSSCKITVKKAPTSLALNISSLTMGIGETFDLNRVLPSDRGSYSVTYSSNNTKGVKVNTKNGIITARGWGTATITAKTYNGKTATCRVKVLKAPTSLSLNKTSITMGIGETFDLNRVLPSGTGAYSVTYSSNNTKGVKVNTKSGLITARGRGTATITAKTYNGKTATCRVKVLNAPTSVSLNKTKLTMDIGDTFDLNRVLPSGTGAYSVTYSSNNTKGVKVNTKNGIVTAKGWGTATITAKTYNGKTATCRVTVNKPKTYTDDDLFCLAAVIWQEAGASWISDRVQLMVGNVVLNHVANPAFPDTIRECITRPYAYGTMAWTGVKIPTANDPITKAAIDRCYANAKKLLEGYRILPSNVIYQAGFVQGSGVYAYEGGMYFCYQ